MVKEDFNTVQVFTGSLQIFARPVMKTAQNMCAKSEDTKSWYYGRGVFKNMWRSSR